MATIIRMPQLAAGGDDASIQSWLVEKGDQIAKGQPLAEIETEKAVVEFEAEEDGVFAGVLAQAGDTVAVGTPIGVVAVDGESIEDAFAEAGGQAGDSGDPVNAVEPQTDVAATATPTAEGADETADRPDVSAAASCVPKNGERIFASPIARKLAKDSGVEVTELSGTGPNGRIVRRDVEDYLAGREEDTPVADAKPSAPTRSPAATVAHPETGYEDVPHTGMRRAIARRLTESKSTVPHFYLDADIRVDALLALRKEINSRVETKVSVNDLVVKAVAKAMQAVPDANAIWLPEATRKFESVDIAIAVAVPGGLLTPVVRGVDSKSLSTLSAEIRGLAERARDGKIKQHELEGGSFSVSNLGMYGTKRFSAIINPPQSGILAVGAAEKRPVVNDAGELEAATVMSVTLSADHRVVDGALAAEWLRAFVQVVESPMSILI